MRLGEFLRNERLRKGIDLETAAEETRIKEVYLRALEEENYDLIPGEIYQRHYFKTYLEYLGHEDLYFRLTRERPKPAQMSDRMVRKPTDDAWDTARYIRVLWRLALVIIFIGIVIWSLVWLGGRVFGARGETQPKGESPELQIDILQYVPELGDDVDKAIKDAVGPKTDLGDIKSQIANALDEHTLRIDVDGDCWVRVTGPNGELFNGLMKKGDSKDFGPERYFTLTLGKPEVAWVYLDNQHFYGGEMGAPKSMSFTLPPDYGFSDAELDKALAGLKDDRPPDDSSQPPPVDH